MERLFVECTVRAVLIAIGTAAVLWAMRVRTAHPRGMPLGQPCILLMLLLPAWTAWWT